MASPARIRPVIVRYPIMRSAIPWNLNRTVAPEKRAVMVDELKKHMNVTIDEDDEVIADLGLAAEQSVEEELSKALLIQMWVLRLDRFPCWEIPLPRPPLASVTQIQYIDETGTTQVLSTAIYIVDTFSTPGRVHLAYDQVWPSTRDVPNAVIVTYKAGREWSEELPEMVRTAIKQTTGDLYEHRERSAIDAVRQLEMYERLMANHRCYADFEYR